MIEKEKINVFQFLYNTCDRFKDKKRYEKLERKFYEFEKQLNGQYAEKMILGNNKYPCLRFELKGFPTIFVTPTAIVSFADNKYNLQYYCGTSYNQNVVLFTMKHYNIPNLDVLYDGRRKFK